MKRTATVVAALLFAPFLAAQMDEANCPKHKQHAAEAKSPYAQNMANAIKALSPETLDAYRKGTGMGLAIPAELNGYPGPRHLLDLADQLPLNSEQRTRIQAIYDDMHAQAVALGAQIIDLEQALDRGFAERTMTGPLLQSSTAQIASLQGRLRYVHLNAHLAVKEILSDAQVAAYATLRGYGSAPSTHSHHHTN